MKINVKIGHESGPVMKYMKLSLFVIGALIVLPKLIVMFVLMVMDMFVKTYLHWLYDITDTAITMMDD